MTAADAPLRVVFIGASSLGLTCARAVAESGARIVGIVTSPRSFKISYSPDRPVRNVLFADFHELARELDVPCIEIDGPMARYVSAVAEFRPDLILVIGWYHMVPRRMRETARLGAMGIHASLLPRLRGGAPLVWALIRGESRTGVTLFRLSDGVDDGEILGQREFAIGSADDIADLVAKSTDESVLLLRHVLPRLAAGEVAGTSQDESAATWMPQRKPEDGIIDWSCSRSEIVRFIRAQTRPYPGAFTARPDGATLRVWRAEEGPVTGDAAPGEISTSGAELLVRARDGWVRLTDYEVETAETAVAAT